MSDSAPVRGIGTSSRFLSGAHWGLVFILLLSAFIQFTTARETHVDGPGRPDARSYLSYAYNLRTFGVYSRQATWDTPTPERPAPDAVSPPGYPLFLTLFMSGTPDLPFMLRVIYAQALLGVITTLLVFLLARQVMPSALACVPALLTAITPHLATINPYMLTEALFTTLLTASAFAFVRAVRVNSNVSWGLAGTVFGLCCLVRPALQILLPVIFIAALLLRRLRPIRRQVAIATCCWMVLLLPWFVYQQSVQTPNDPNLLRASIYHGSFPGFVFEGHTENYGYPYRDDPHAAEIMASNAGLEKWVGERMRAEPWRYAKWYLLGKPLYFLAWNDDVAADGDVYIYPVDATPFRSRPFFLGIRSLMLGLHWPLMALAILGALLVCLRSRWLGLSNGSRNGLMVLSITFLSAIGLHMIGAPFPRYGIPFLPLAYVIAVVTAAAGFAMARRRQTAPLIEASTVG